MDASVLNFDVVRKGIDFTVHSSLTSMYQRYLIALALWPHEGLPTVCLYRSM